MAEKTRIVSVSMEPALLARFDRWLSREGLRNRSSGVRRLLREKLEALSGLDESAPAVATVTFVYDHHRRDLMERLAHIQHEHLSEVVASTHVHLDHHRCLEVLILRGAAGDVTALAERIVSTRGVERGDVCLVPADAGAHGHEHDHDHAATGPAWHAAAHAAKPKTTKKRPRK